MNYYVKLKKIRMKGIEMDRYLRKNCISIIVPVYMVEQYLNRCVNSIINQTYGNLEILLVDDGSLDDCPSMCDIWAKKDERIKVIHKKNGGLSDARNKGIDEATGEYLLFVDSDDYLEEDACEKLLCTMKKTDADFVVGVIREIRDNKIFYQKRTNVENNIVYTNKEFIIKSIDANEWYAPSVINLYKTAFINQHSLKFKIGLLHEDIEMLPRVYLAADRIGYIDYPFYNYEIREQSIMTSDNREKKVDSITYIYTEWKKEFDTIVDKELKSKMYGALIKYYLRTCRQLKIKRWTIPEVDFKFALSYALNLKEKIKVIFFEVLPNLYISLGNQD